MSALVWEPRTMCAVCVNTDKKQVTATQMVTKDGRSYRTCDAHLGVVERCPSIQDAINEVRRQNQIGGAV